VESIKDGEEKPWRGEKDKGYEPWS
jgi:hypothetical protein